MANLVGEFTVDSPNTDGNCIYNAEPLGGQPTVSPNIQINGQPLRSYDATSRPSDVTAVKVNPLIPVPCQPGVRIVTPTVNTTVFMNGKLPAVTGDQAAIAGTPRPLTGPFQHANILIGTSGGLNI